MSCCSNPFQTYVNGKWACETCGEGPDDQTQSTIDQLDLFYGKPFSAQEDKKCTCGADKTHGKGNKHHVSWCDKK